MSYSENVKLIFKTVGYATVRSERVYERRRRHRFVVTAHGTMKVNLFDDYTGSATRRVDGDDDYKNSTLFVFSNPFIYM